MARGNLVARGVLLGSAVLLCPTLWAQHEPAKYPVEHPLAGHVSQAEQPAAHSLSAPEKEAEREVKKPPEPVKPEFTFAYGYISGSGILLSKDIGRHCSGARVRNGKEMEGQMVVYARKFNCMIGTYASEMVEFYYRGQRFYSPATGIDTSSFERVAKNSDLTFEQAEVLRPEWEKESELLRHLEIEKALKAIDKTKGDGLAILARSVYDESEHTEGTGFEVTVHNTSKHKTIKYITFSVVGYNAVKDPVRGRRGQTTQVLRGIGPIESESTATYSQPYMWNTDVVERARISQIRLEFMDGSAKTLANPEARLLMEPNVMLTIEAPDPE